MDEYEPGKMFVGGLSWETQELAMKAYFEQFGTVADCVIMRDQMQPPGVKKNRGFGFVKFEDPNAVDKVLQHPIHALDNKTIDPKRAQKKSGGRDNDKKVFIGGLASSTTEQDVKDHFSHHYGGVTEVVFKVDRTTNRKRGFGFVVFESQDYVDRVLQAQYHEIDGKSVEVKRTEPRSATASAMRHTNPAVGYTFQHPYPQGDYRSAANGQQYPQYYGGGGGGQGFYPPYGTPAQTGYGQQYSSGPPNYSYDQSAYPRTQTSTGDRQDSQAPYYQHANPYGHGGQQMGQQVGQQMGPYGQEAGSYAGRTAYGGGQDGYGQQSGGYGRGGSQPHPRYGGYGH